MTGTANRRVATIDRRRSRSDQRAHARTSDLSDGPTSDDDRSGGRTISCAFVDTALGRVLVGSTEKGLCSIRIGDDDRAMRAGLEADFPRDRVVLDAELLAPILQVVAKLAAGDGGAATPLPLDIDGTAFQLRVWAALTRVEPGTTVSYSELARRVGRPRAHRAVANACAANPVALVVPCHRVVRADGSLGGFGWGVERKVALLDSEARSETPLRSDARPSSQ